MSVENEVVLARLAALGTTVRSLKPGGKGSDTVVAVVQECLGFLAACSAQDVVTVTIKVLEDAIVLSPQAGTILRLEGGLKLVVKHLKAAVGVPAVAGPCSRILAIAAATSTVTQQALSKEKGIGALLLNAAALHVRDPVIAAPLCEAMAHISRSPKGAAQLECEGLLPLLQEALVLYMGAWHVFGWALKLVKNLAKYEYVQYGGAAVGGGGAAAGPSQGASLVAARGGGGALSAGGEGARLLLGVARVLARVPEQRKLLKRASRALWLLCPHLLVPLPPLEPLAPLSPKDSPHLSIPSAGEADVQRHQELFPEEYTWQQPQQPPLLAGQGLMAQQQQQQGPQGGGGGGGAQSALVPQPLLAGGGSGAVVAQCLIRPLSAPPGRPPSARQLCRTLAATSCGVAGGGGGGQQAVDVYGNPVVVNPALDPGPGFGPEPFHSYGAALDGDMMLHDLTRIANPRGLLNRVVYLNTAASSSSSSSLRGQGGGTGDGGGQDGVGSPAATGTGMRAQRGTGAGAAPAAGGMLPDLSRLAIGGDSDATRAAGHDGYPSASSRAPSSSSQTESLHLPDISDRSHHGPQPGSANSSVHGGRANAGGGGGRGGGAGVLSFHSCFESGNLRCAAQVGPREYDLFLAADLNDRSEGGNLCQWFYFAVTVPPEACSSGSSGSSGSGGGAGPRGSGSEGSGPGPSQEGGGGGGGGGGGAGQGVGQGPGVKFNIVNLRKKESLFSLGKRPIMCFVRPSSAAAGGGGAGGAGAGGGGGGMAASPLTAGSRTASASSTSSLMAAAAGAALGAPQPPAPTDPGVWIRVGSHVAYYPSPYRGRPTLPGEGAAARKGKKPSAAAAAAGGAGAAPGGGKKGAKGKGAKAAAADGDGDGASSTLQGIGPGLYCATFTVHFPAPGTYYIASCYPYTYTDMQEHLDGLQRRLAAEAAAAAAGPPMSRPGYLAPPPMVRSTLCYSLSGLRTELLTITDWGAPMEAVRQRECIFITARVHPGETCASWIMQGILEFLCSPDPAAATLRSSFVFKLVPMLNPDGVANGNYRCSLAGVDLNRVWDRPLRGLYPTVYHSKRLLQQLAAAGRLALYIDIHGHSTKTDTFFYGCEPSAAALQTHGGSSRDLRGPPQAPGEPPAPQGVGVPPYVQQAPMQGMPGGPQPTGAGGGGLALQGTGAANGGGCGGAGSPGMGSAAGGVGLLAAGAAAGGAAGGAGAAAGTAAAPAGLSARVAARLRVRMLPYLTARISTDYSFPKCSFKIRKVKLSAARVVVHRELGVAGSYTLEASLGGGSAAGAHFGARDYLGMGANLCRAICELAEVDDSALLEEMHARVTLSAL
ncbi:hypothetical protein HXX76_006736 [Chlamydomonas incerta]|uniref:Peptidase M14 domain-containing protein n=1 Tax=Chlamydomonas incerta TaxID=51695 RepID=A0A835T076_CHLIN|nr:hypothetical protein HXX76_006736 [Chlamydomonas incerta]|eukprot:KAG2436433.1 hypothetical protein HXX76_006736 [Chlamydomonas incerta]